MLQRSAGLLLHPTSLPGPFGIGDLGPSADAFLDWAQAAGQRYWQMLPLGPVGPSGSPYSSASAFAGNPLLLSPELLAQDGLLTGDDLAALRGTGKSVDFGAVLPAKEALLRRAWQRMQGGHGGPLKRELEEFRGAPQQALWLEDWALFAALRDRYQGQPWWTWEDGLAGRREEALARARDVLQEEVGYHCWVQCLFHRQWARLKHQAEARKILLFGDLPIYCARDSADVWAHQDLFELGEDLNPIAVAGVPPDAFSATGQLWGNPLYRWDRMEERGFSWWIDRVAADLSRVDVLRFDHFRGFEAYWRVPAGESTAEVGEWRKGPGQALFEALAKALGRLPVVAEDLGVITDAVRDLRRDLELPGIAVLHFAFGEGAQDHAPDLVGNDRVIYTGTHDNETTVGWFRNLDGATQSRVLDACGGEADADTGDLDPWDAIRWVYSSAAAIAMVPVQDVLGLGNEARMNVPGKGEGNWAWRLEEGALQGTVPGGGLSAGGLSQELARRLRDLAEASGRRCVL